MDLTLVTGNANLESYEIVSFIGDGSFGTVHIVTDKTRSTLRRAMKMIDKVKLCKLHSMDRVLKEVSIHRSLNHPNVVQLYQFFENENYLYMIMDLCEHGDLDRLLKKSQIPAKFNVFICMHEIIQGLEYLHRLGIVHRDIKPGNLLVTSEYTIKLADFGSAVYESELRDMKRIPRCGTPSYMAPEAVSELPYGREVDIWALGCVFYVILVGRTPFAGTSKEVFQKITAASYALPDKLPCEARNLLCSILQKHPQKRPELTQIRQHGFFSLEVFPSDIYVSRSCMNTRVLTDRRGINMQQVPESRQNSLKRQNSLQQMHSNTSGNFTVLSNDNTKVASGTIRDCLRSTSQQDCTSRQGQLDNHRRDSSNCDLYVIENGRLPSTAPSDGTLKAQQPSSNSSLHRSRSCSVSDWHDQTSLKQRQPSDNRHRSSSNNPLTSNSASRSRSTHADNSASLDSGFINSGSENGSCRGFVSDNLAGSGGRIKELWPADGHSHSRNQRSNSVAPGSWQSVHYKETGHSHSHSHARHTDARSSATADKRRKHKAHGKIEKPPPIDITRVRMGRHCMKTIVCTVVEDHWLVVEILRTSNKNSKEVEEVLRISPNGMQIEHFLPNHGKGYVLKDTPVDLQKTEDNSYMVFDYARLPENLWRKYSFAAVFAKIVRTRTPVVTYHSREDQAKAVLMDNMPEPDFELRFYDGTTFVQSDKTLAKIILKDGKTLPPTSSTVVLLVPDYGKKMKSLPKLYKKCMDIEKNICLLESTLSTTMFPVIIGQKEAKPPESNLEISNGSSGIGSDETLSSGGVSMVRNCQSSSSVKSNESKYTRPLQKFEADALGSQTNNIQSRSMNSGHLVTRNDDIQMESHSDQLKRREASMPSIKSYLKLADGGLLVRFSDRRELVLNKLKGEVVYTDPNGVEMIFPSGSEMPVSIYQKIYSPELQELIHRHFSAATTLSSTET